MDKNHDNLRYVRMFQDITGIDSSGMPRFSPVMLYRKEVGQELFDEIMQSRRGEKILKALIKTEAIFDDRRSLFNVFATEEVLSDDLSDSLKENLAPLVLRHERSIDDVTDIEPPVTSDLHVFCDKIVLCTKNLLEPLDSDDLAVVLEEASSDLAKNLLEPLDSDLAVVIEEVSSDVGMLPDILTYLGMFYGRNVKINVHYLQDKVESNNCNYVLLKMLLYEAKIEIIEQMMKGVCRSEKARDGSENLESTDSINFTFNKKDQRCSPAGARKILYREYPVDTSEFITKSKLVFSSKNAKTLLWRRIVEFNKFIVSTMELIDIGKAFGYL